MAPGRVISARECDRVSALAAGLAAITIGWVFAAAFAPDELESLSQYSPWLYGPAAIALWALFSAIAYLLISRDQRQRELVQLHEGYRCREFAAAASANCGSVCANLEEKTRLAAMTAGFALVVSAWVAALSFVPGAWLEWVSKTPPWSYCVATVLLWAALSKAMHMVFRVSRERFS